MTDTTASTVTSVSAETSSAPKRAGRPVKPDSNLSKARGVYASLTASGASVSRKDVVSAFLAQIPDMKKGVANTYYHLIVGKKSK